MQGEGMGVRLALLSRNVLREGLASLGMGEAAQAEPQMQQLRDAS